MAVEEGRSFIGKRHGDKITLKLRRISLALVFSDVSHKQTLEELFRFQTSSVQPTAMGHGDAKSFLVT